MISKTTNPADESVLDDLVDEVIRCIRTGAKVDINQLAAGIPEVAERLRQIVPAIEAIAQWDPELDDEPEQLEFDEPVNKTLGDFLIVRQIGKGGMGVVYEAQQISIKRAVALKVLPFAALLDPRALQRFKNEVTAVATLEHPHIVSVYAIGEERGIHYYAMRLIRGQSMAAVIRELQTRALNQNSVSGESLSQVVASMPQPDEARSHAESPTRPYEEEIDKQVDTVARGQSVTGTSKITDHSYFRNVVSLMIQASDALHHAHQQGIVHRDVKPENLLLDAQGQLFVTDFGLARIENAPALTLTGDFLGTLRYMSPEQVQAGRVMVDHRTDIYSLGATLYELLTLTPIWSDTNRADLLRRVSLEEPLPPRKLNPVIPNDLETIVLKAISRNPNERYDSARTLAEDLQRFLDYKPIEAKRPTVTQRIHKWTHRNPAIVLSAVLLLVLATIAAAVSAVLISNQEKLATAAAANERIAKESAEQRLAQLVRGNEIITSIFKDLNINEIKDGPDPLETVLAKRLVNSGREITGQAIGDPLMVAEMQDRLGSSLLSLGFAKEALELLKKSHQTRSELLEANDPDLLRTVAHLATAYGVTGDRAKSIELHEQMLLLKTDSLARCRSLANLGIEYVETGQIDQAIEVQKQALELIEHLPGQSVRAIVMYNLAMAYKASGQFDKALPMIKESLELDKQQFGQDNVRTLARMNALASIYSDVGRSDEALALFEQTLESRKNQLSLDHPRVLESMNNLAVAYKSAGQLEKATPVLRQLVETQQAKLGIDHPSTLLSMNNLASAYHDTGQVDKAIALHEKTFEIRKSKLGLDHPDTVISMSNLAVDYKETGQLNRALPLFEQTLELKTASMGLDHPSTLISMTNLAFGYLAAGDLDQAVPLFQQTLALNKSKWKSGDAYTPMFMSNLALVYREAGQLDQALPICEQSIELLKAKRGPDHPSTLNCMKTLALVYRDKDQLDQAVPLLEKTRELMIAKRGPTHRVTLICMADLGVAYKHAGKLDESLQLLEEVHRAANTECDIKFGAELVDAYVNTGKEKEAEKLATEVLETVRANLPADCPELARQLALLSRAYFLPEEAFTDAESLLRESLAIREKSTPGNWRTFETQSLLGEALQGLEKYAEAEPLLLAGYDGLIEREKSIAPIYACCLAESIKRLVKLYESWDADTPDAGYDTKAAQWQHTLEEHKSDRSTHSNN